MKSPLNDRQLDVLKWIAEGRPAGRWPEDDLSYKSSAAALKSRGLVTITGHARTWSASTTEAGNYYLEHGTYPPNSSSVQASAARAPDSRAHDSDPAALKIARAMIERLQDEGTIAVADPDEKTRASYRRALHACRSHHLLPVGQELRFTGRDTGDIVITLVTGSPADETNWNRIRLTTRKVTTNLGALQTALETSSILGQLSESLRPRATDFLLDLAERLRAEDLKLGANVKLKTPKVFLQVGSKRRDGFLTEIHDEVPHEMTPQEQRELRRAPWKQIPKVDHVPSGRLLLRVNREGSHMTEPDSRGNSWCRQNVDEFSDTKRKSLEQQARQIARAIKKGVDDDRDAREREERRREQARLEFERQKAEELRTWQEVRSRARDKAMLELREATFIRAFTAWQEAREMRAFAEQLQADAVDQQLLASRPRLQQWLEWARDRADEIDPVKNLARLDDDVFDAEPTTEDLRPHMEGWGPSAPHKDYSAAYRKTEQQAMHVPQPRSWHPGMIGRPSWWRH